MWYKTTESNNITPSMNKWGMAISDLTKGNKYIIKIIHKSHNEIYWSFDMVPVYLKIHRIHVFPSFQNDQLNIIPLWICCPGWISPFTLRYLAENTLPCKYWRYQTNISEKKWYRQPFVKNGSDNRYVKWACLSCSTQASVVKASLPSKYFDFS